jgi:hypothetical protein
MLLRCGRLCTYIHSETGVLRPHDKYRLEAILLVIVGCLRVIEEVIDELQLIVACDR